MELAWAARLAFLTQSRGAGLGHRGSWALHAEPPLLCLLSSSHWVCQDPPPHRPGPEGTPSCRLDSSRGSLGPMT